MTNVSLCYMPMSSVNIPSAHMTSESVGGPVGGGVGDLSSTVRGDGTTLPNGVQAFSLPGVKKLVNEAMAQGVNLYGNADYDGVYQVYTTVVAKLLNAHIPPSVREVLHRLEAQLAVNVKTFDRIWIIREEGFLRILALQHDLVLPDGWDEPTASVCG